MRRSDEETLRIIGPLPSSLSLCRLCLSVCLSLSVSPPSPVLTSLFQEEARSTCGEDDSTIREASGLLSEYSSADSELKVSAAETFDESKEELF
jgi:hypothetical protein